ncbi:allantoate amidohydrolase [Microbacterium sp. MEC084]|uniref:allantoate amidohydrolase n=1 Tax=unclassified Microbacterium TaxID=2609290 RepID=UPI0006FCE4D5|nr:MULTISPECIES: allantoate amidohydrolase [unclassified Microbacterium]KQZ03703.1 Zn-dependent hydrolase [Microbacterium sp. Root53]MCD1269899.1 allantoate amidohydrolase [Microbacterium sp. MEC084]
MLAEIAHIGADPRGGYSRPGYGDEDRELREWFVGHAQARGLDVHRDGNGILWAWWRPEGSAGKAIVTGSHLDSVPGGGGYDGPLGVASALAAVDVLRARGTTPSRPLALAVFPEEEGSRFGLACLGSRLMAGAVDPERALALTDREGDTLADAVARDGLDPRHVGLDRAALDDTECFVELHVEQGRGLVDLGRPIAIGASILGHGRWRVVVGGQGNHAGTTLMADRRDPMVAAARLIVAIRDLARGVPDARATVGRIEPVPGGTNVIASRVAFWLDVRHPDDLVTADLVTRIRDAVALIAAEEGCAADVREESLSPTVDFDRALRADLRRALPDTPELGTGAGHDAGVLADAIPTAMLFVRNPTGISHSPEELVEDADAETGADALADVLSALAGPSV